MHRSPFTPLKTRLHNNDSSNLKNILTSNFPLNPQFADQLDRFTKDFAHADQEERHRRLSKQQEADYYRQHRIYELENHFHDNSQEIREIKRIAALQKRQFEGKKVFAFTGSKAYNPITNLTESTARGDNFLTYEKENKIDQLVRAHHIQKMGNSNYNIINGREQLDVLTLAPQESGSRLAVKIDEFQARFKLQAGPLKEARGQQ